MSINVVKMEFVTPNEEGELVPMAVTPTSDPRPVVELADLAVGDFSLAGETATVTISGKVWDALADSVAGGVCEIDEVKVYANAELVATLTGPELTKVTETVSGAEKLIRPYAHRQEFSTQITFPVVEGNNTVWTAVTNSLDNEGDDSVTVNLSRGSSRSFSHVVNVYIANELAFGQVDEITYFQGERDVEPDDPEFAEVSEDAEAETSVFEGTLYEGEPFEQTVQVIVTDFTGLNAGVEDSFTGTVRYATGTAWAEYTGTFSETGNDTKLFRLSLTISGAPGDPYFDFVVNRDSTPVGTFVPVLVRVDGDPDTLEGFTINGQEFQVVEFDGQKFLGLSPPTVFAMIGKPRTEVNLFEEALVVVKEGLNLGTQYGVRVNPKRIRVGESNVVVEIDLARTGVDFPFDDATDSFHFYRKTVVDGQQVEQTIQPTAFTAGKTDIRGTITNATEEMVGYWSLVLNVGGKESPPIPFVLRIFPKIRMILTFDDGPSIEPYAGTTPTGKVLDILAGEGIKAVFFVLTGPDVPKSWPLKRPMGTYPKAETPEGFALLKREIQEGHVVACHHGGLYESQHNTHPDRTTEPAYDYDGDLDIADDCLGDPTTSKELETDLLQCKRRINEAYLAVTGQNRVADATPWFVRPPLWKYNEAVLDIYDELRLKMILSDSWLKDTGYAAFPGAPLESVLLRHIKKSIEEWRADIVLTMHDSNTQTVDVLANVLELVRTNMTEWGYQEGAHWDFVKDTDEVIAILKAYRTCHREPDLEVQDISTGWRNHDE
jgi:peptidoglycan/xylan/chitin deacetylase (PgdA/CDA1 family)